MPRTRPVSLSALLNRVKNLAADLSHELARTDGNSPATRAMADQIGRDADAALRELKRPKR